jgi:hypothetical protein
MNHEFDYEDLSLLRDEEHAETEAVDLMLAFGIETTIDMMVNQLHVLSQGVKQTGHPGFNILFHCMWLGWNQVYRTYKERQNAEPAEGEDETESDQGS